MLLKPPLIRYVSISVSISFGKNTKLAKESVNFRKSMEIISINNVVLRNIRILFQAKTVNVFTWELQILMEILIKKRHYLIKNG